MLIRREKLRANWGANMVDKGETLSDLAALLRFENPQTGVEALVSVATVLQCLCVSRNAHLVPELPADWKKTALPEAIEAMSILSAPTLDEEGREI